MAKKQTAGRLTVDGETVSIIIPGGVQFNGEVTGEDDLLVYLKLDSGKKASIIGGHIIAIVRK